MRETTKHGGAKAREAARGVPMSKRTGKITMAAVAGAALLTAPVAAACESGPTYEQWASTDGAAGRINLDEVQEAFKQSDSATDFEERVNQIYEGDGIILIRVDQDGETLTLEGWEDLNSSRAIEEASDDRLFAIVRNNQDEHEMRGYGANGYYHSRFGVGDFLFTYMLLSAFNPIGGRYYYSTPTTRYDSLSRNRAQYRNTGSYRTQVSRNTGYFDRQKTFAGSQYDQASRNVSRSRQTYLNSQRSTGSFRTSSTGVRSNWGSSIRSSSRGFGTGFTGGGGARAIGFGGGRWGGGQIPSPLMGEG